MRAIDEGVQHSGDGALLAQSEERLRAVEVVVVEHQQRLRIHPARPAK